MYLYQNISIPDDRLRAFCKHYPIRSLKVFGSVLRDDFAPESDLDVLVEFEPDAGITYLDMVIMQDELTAIFGRKVDLLTPNALSKYFRQTVLNEAVAIYECR